ncbi:MAG: hypothetical protein ACK4YP_06095 [Myxococcota bacterium]
MRVLSLLAPTFFGLVACSAPKDGEDTAPAAAPPFGMILEEDGQLYAGVARIDITPTDFETYSDLNGNHSFDGCITDPTASRSGCDEPFDDLDGDGRFDGVWIAGFGSARAALGVHDPITVTAVVLSLDGEYVALVGIDALGLLENRIRDTRDALAAAGFDRDRLIVSSSHSHQGPDTVGIYGIDEDLLTGIYPPFVDNIPVAIQDAVETAAGTMVAVSPTQGAVRMRDLDPVFNGVPFGGINPDPSVEGGINDIRDPLIVADQVLAIALDGADGRVATIVNASGHPEVVGADNSEISSDYVGYLRDYTERRSGGLTVFLSGALGGMQSALGSTLPAIDEDGNRVLDETGAPTWIEDGDGPNWEFARTWGTLVGQAAEAALTDTTPWTSLRVRTADVLVPVDNASFKLAFQVNLLDTPHEYVVQDASCPGYGTNNELFGCVPTGVWTLELGPVTFGTVPGELMPELFWGVPDEAAMADASLRTTDRRWVQFDADCAAVPYEDCKATDGSVGDCDCLKHHAAPYRITDDTGVDTIEAMLPGTYKAPVGIANGYCGYIVPQPDYNTYVSVLTDDGDHYEETNSCSESFAPLVLEAFASLRE